MYLVGRKQVSFKFTIDKYIVLRFMIDWTYRIRYLKWELVPASLPLLQISYFYNLFYSFLKNFEWEVDLHFLFISSFSFYFALFI